MIYNFDQLIPRRHTGSYKWDSDTSDNILPMWVADMDFAVCPDIVHALEKRVSHPIYGYTRVGDSYYEALTRWFERRHGWTISRDSVIYTSGVVPAVSAVIKALTRPGDKVVIMTPVYNCFFSSIRNNGCIASASPLLYGGGRHTIDFDDLEARASDPAAKVLLLCNPHNPGGRVWTRGELRRVGDICLRHGLTVISDEIHCELVFGDRRYTPFATLGPEYAEASVSCVSPSKAFNIAGLQIANIVCVDAGRRALIDRAINDNEVCDVNPFGVVALEAAYNRGGEWLAQMLAYVRANYEYMRDYCACRLPEFPIAELEGTYLVWMDCRSLGISSSDLERKLKAETGLWLNAGDMYGPDGDGFMRWNIACPRARLTDGLDRFYRFVTRC